MRLARIAFVVAAACASMYAVDAAAKEPPTATVDYSAYDLSVARDVDKLYAKLRSAARRVCAPVEGTTYKRGPAWRECYNDALTRAVSQVNSESMTALHIRRQREQPV